MSNQRPGYDDGPQLPGSRWRIHDRDRPYPPVVDAGAASESVLSQRPPSDAVVLFDGTDLVKWRDADGGPAGWRVQAGYAEVAGDSDIWTREEFGDCQLHLEWATPSAVRGEGQGRGNSGVFLMDRYEIQVLDSWQNPTYADGQAGAMYAQRPPLVNASRPPGEWQTYDAVFLAPRFEGERLLRPAAITLLHNGVAVHVNWQLLGHTHHLTLPTYEASHGSPGPLRLQNHGGDLVRYRNIWMRRLIGYEPD